MHCSGCGGEIIEGDDFCASCGAPVAASGGTTPQFPQGPPGESGGPSFGAVPAVEPPAGKPGGFFSTPGGIVLIVCIALLVIAGIIVTAVLATRDGSSDGAVTTKTTSPGTKTEGWGQVSQAEAVMGMMLPKYVSRGYAAITGYMSAAMKRRYETADPPWSQVSYTMKSARVIEKKATGPDTVVFTVEEKLDDMGTPATQSMHYTMVKEGGTWKLDSIEEVLPTATTDDRSTTAAQDEASCKQAMQAYLDTWAEYPFEPLRYQSFTWNDTGRTGATARVTAISGDASSQDFTLSAVKGGDGTWIVTMK